MARAPCELEPGVGPIALTPRRWDDGVCLTAGAGAGDVVCSTRCGLCEVAKVPSGTGAALSIQLFWRFGAKMAVPASFGGCQSWRHPCSERSGCLRSGEGPLADPSRSASCEVGLGRGQKLRAGSVESAVVDRNSSVWSRDSRARPGSVLFVRSAAKWRAGVVLVRCWLRPRAWMWRRGAAALRRCILAEVVRRWSVDRWGLSVATSMVFAAEAWTVSRLLTRWVAQPKRTPPCRSVRFAGQVGQGVG